MDIPATIRLVQAKLKITVDGIAGQQTWRAIADALDVSLVAPSADSRRDKIIAIARGCVGWKEATGNNDGPKIDDILSSCGLKGTRQPYCAAFIRFVYDRAGLSVGPKKGDAAWSPNWVAGATWTKAKGGEAPLPGDAFGIYFKNKGRVAHCGIILEWHATHCLTIEGNTSADAAIGTEADREGQGVFIRRRDRSEIYAVRNWLD